MIIGNLGEECTTKPHATNVSLLETSAKSALQNLTHPTCHYWKAQRRVHYKASRTQRVIIGKLSEECTTKLHAPNVSLLESSAKSALQSFTHPTCHYWKPQRRVHFKTSRNKRVIIGNLSEECTTKPHATNVLLLETSAKSARQNLTQPTCYSIVGNLSEECTTKPHATNVSLLESSAKSALQNLT